MSRFTAAFSSCAALLRKVHKPKRFDRVRAARPLQRKVTDWWFEGLDSLWEHLEQNKAWDTIHRHTRLADAGKSVRKELSDDERRLIDTLLKGFDYFDDAGTVAASILSATSVDTFERAATLALSQIGVRAADFTLRNDQIRDALLDRKSAAVFATRHNIDSVMESILTNFYELGRNPFDKEFLTDLRSELGDVTVWQAKRFALTETAIAAELAQRETWQRNGVTRTQWNILGDKTRPSHERMNGEQADFGSGYKLVSDDGEIYVCAGPGDPKLPAHELINCHCWSTPVVSDEFQLDPKRLWEGQ